MKKIIALAWVIILPFSAYCQQSKKDVADSLANIYLQNANGALVIGIIENGIATTYFYGETKNGNKVLPDTNSIFELGELSETFTSILYSELILKGIINADDRLKSFLPFDVPSPTYEEIVCKPAAENYNSPTQKGDVVSLHFTPYVCFPDPSSKPQEILLCDLATHTTGLPKLPGNLKLKNKQNPYADYTKEHLYAFLKSFHFAKPIGYDYQYSATGIALLGHALEQKTKTEFEELIYDRLLQNLNMHGTRINLLPHQQQYLLEGHDAFGNVKPNWKCNILAPALGFHSSINDMMRFLEQNIRLQKDYYTNLLDYTHNARIRLTGKKNKGKEIALGWKINPIKNEKRIVWQSGITGGFASYIGFVETDHTGVVILSSIAKEVQSTGEHLLEGISISHP